jgi:hypothetical protein
MRTSPDWQAAGGRKVAGALHRSFLSSAFSPWFRRPALP